MLSEADRPVVTIHAPRVAREEAEGAEGEQQPEVISERKEREKE